MIIICIISFSETTSLKTNFFFRSINNFPINNLSFYYQTNDSLIEAYAKLNQKIFAKLNQKIFFPNSKMKNSFDKINKLFNQCSGVMTLEYNFFRAFMDLDIDKIHSVYEIPPFGSHHDNKFLLFHPKKINCLFISKSLSESYGISTNFRSRFINYINIYKNELIQQGAKEYQISYYGVAIIL